MADFGKYRVTHYPAAVLGKPAEPVEKVDEGIHRLVEKMTELMIEHKGVGFAAPQAGVGLRLFIISLDGSRQNVRVYINPNVTCEGPAEANEEGCLSVPGVYTKIRRFKKCTVRATDLEGREFAEQAEGLYARALQHEYDHIEGVTIVNRMDITGRIANRRKLKKLAEEQEKS